MSFKKTFKDLIIKNFYSYNSEKFIDNLHKLGLSTGDAVMVHSSWAVKGGFKGKPVDMINALKEVVGEDGLLSMTSMTYHNESSRDYLVRNIPMNVRRSASKMGLLTEVFRRGKEVRRSLSPTHPILAWGEKADWFLDGHERLEKSFGPDSPFDKLLQLNGKILCIDVPFSTITYSHFLEDRVSHLLPFDLYDPQLMEGVVLDYEGKEMRVPVRVISLEANSLRREERLIAELDKQGIIKRSRVGNTRLLLINCKEMTECVDDMMIKGRSFFDIPS